MLTMRPIIILQSITQERIQNKRVPISIMSSYIQQINDVRQINNYTRVAKVSRTTRPWSEYYLLSIWSRLLVVLCVSRSRSRQLISTNEGINFPIHQQPRVMLSAPRLYVSCDESLRHIQVDSSRICLGQFVLFASQRNMNIIVRIAPAGPSLPFPKDKYWCRRYAQGKT